MRYKEFGQVVCMLRRSLCLHEIERVGTSGMYADGQEANRVGRTLSAA